jgi:hypothetical protein
MPESKKSRIINENNYEVRGFPYPYFKEEVLRDEEINFHIY